MVFANLVLPLASLVVASQGVDGAGCRALCELVIAHCEEDLGWVADATVSYRSVFIYSKCGRAIPQRITDHTNVVVTRLTNVGSNDYAYLEHIARHLDDVAPLTVFCEGGKNTLCDPNTVLRPSPDLYEHAALPQFTRQALMDHQLSNHMPYAVMHHRVPESLGNFSLRSYEFRNSPANAHHPFVASGHPNFGHWLEATLGGALSRHLFTNAEWLAYGGFFAAERANVRRPCFYSLPACAHTHSRAA